MQNADKFDFLINRLSGTVLRLGEEAVKAGLRDTFGERIGYISFIDGKDVATSTKNWVAAHAGSSRALVIGGGDGTVLAAAGEIIGRQDVMLGVLPLGTHNLFARQLGFAADFRKAAAQYADSAPADIDVGTVNGKYFLCGLMIDKNSVKFYAAREDMRIGKHFRAWRKLGAVFTGVAFGRKNKLVITPPQTEGAPQGQVTEVSGRLFFVMDNKMNPRPLFARRDNDSKMMSAVENLLDKDTHEDGLMSLYAVRGGVASAVSMLPSAVRGTWHEHADIALHAAPAMNIMQKTAKPGDRTTIILDGESVETTYPLRVRSIPAGLRVYRPNNRN